MGAGKGRAFDVSKREGRGDQRTGIRKELNAVPDGCGGGYGVSEELSWNVLVGCMRGLHLGDGDRRGCLGSESEVK